MVSMRLDVGLAEALTEMTPFLIDVVSFVLNARLCGSFWYNYQK